MKLNVGERGLLTGLLPKEGDFDTLKVLHELRMSLGFSDEERQQIVFSNYENPDGGMGTRWQNNIVADIPITKSGMRIIEDMLIDLNKKKKLPSEAFTLYEKFIEDA